MTARTITIAIASAGRPSLRRCLESIAAIEVPAGAAIDIVIADDSRDGRVPVTIAALAPFRFPLRVVATAAGNVSVARNACLDAAGGDLIAFVDDDEWVEPAWLVRLLAAMADFDADCVFGPVHPQYPPSTPAWIVRANPLHVDWGRRGRRVAVGRSGNTLLKRALVVQHAVRFDSALGRTGGEDTRFFHDLGAHGAVMVVTDDALVREETPPSRLSVGYFRHRALRTGQVYGRFVLATSAVSLPARVRFYAGATVKAAAALGAAALFYPFDRARALRLAIRGWMNVGKLRELFGLSPAEMI